MAIALDATSSSANQTGSSVTFSHTCTGSNRILIVGVAIADNSDTVTGVTYNSVALTSIASADNFNGSRNVTLWYLIAPATGANNIVVTLSGTPAAFFSVGAASYTGVKQSGQPDAFGSYSGTSSTVDYTKSITTVADNCWLVGVLTNGNSLNPTADSGTTLRLSVYNRSGNGYELFLLDSNGAKTPASSYALGVSADAGAGAVIVASLAPFTVQNLTLTANTVAFTLTGNTTILGKLYTLVAGIGSFILTGIDNIMTATGWTNQSKNSSTFSNQSKSSSSWTNQSKH
jgi:hypothetical protein